MPSPESAMENLAPGKRARGRPKAGTGKVTKAKAPVRRASAGRAVAARKNKREALADKTNRQNDASDTEEVDDFKQEENKVMAVVSSGDELEATLQLVPRNIGNKRSKAGSKPAKTTKSTSTIDTPEPPHLVTRTIPSSTRQGQYKRQPSVEPRQRQNIVHETQQSALEIDDDDDEELEEPTLKPVARHHVARSASQSRYVPLQTRRAGSASDTERNDPSIRRKLGELTKKFENLDLRYRNLREIGIREAEHNFERFRKQSEESSKAASSLISSLKTELAAQNAQLKESRAVKSQIEAYDAEVKKLQAKVAQLTGSLSEAHMENKTLSAKLAANRNAAVTVESMSAKGPGSAVKSGGSIRMIGSAEAVQAAQTAQLKEDLYSDLTGLIIRGVKREPEEDIYDCIQTGRNGTLHFKLAVANEKSAESYDEAQCIYIPQLDPSRDKALMDMLPDYLVDEITFPRPQAGKFYARVVKALTEKQF